MVAGDVCELSLTEMSRRIAARELSSVDAVRAAIARLELVESKLNAFITVIREGALLEAEQADRDIAAGRYRGPLRASRAHPERGEEGHRSPLQLPDQALARRQRCGPRYSGERRQAA